jgi:hypothetical protein
MRLVSEFQQLASRIDLHQSRRGIFIKLPNRFPEVLSYRALAGGRQTAAEEDREAERSHHNKAYSFFRLRAGATLRGRLPNRFVLRNTDHAGAASSFSTSSVAFACLAMGES